MMRHVGSTTLRAAMSRLREGCAFEEFTAFDDEALELHAVRSIMAKEVVPITLANCQACPRFEFI